jgi:VCBS repeat-containing protein
MSVVGTTSTSSASSVVVVSSVAGLNAALAAARSGETIQLAPGTYAGVNISNLNFASSINITSEFASSKAVLSGLKVTNVSGVNFSNIDLTTVGVSDPYYAFRITSSSNLSFSGINAYGSSSIAPGTQTSGFLIEHSTGVSIQNSNFSYMNNGIAAEYDNSLNFSGNNFTYMSKGGIQAGQVTNALISNNYFTNFETSAGVHSDAIQFFTAGTTAASQNIEITNNTYFRGAGTAAQGIFLGDEVGTLAYQDVTISGNQIIGGDWNSIYLNHAAGSVSISGNYVASWTGFDVVSGSVINNMLGRIVTGNLSQAVLSEANNTSQGYISGSATISPPAGNQLLGAIAPVLSLSAFSAQVTAPPCSSNVLEHNSGSGNVLTNASGGVLSLTAIGTGSGAEKAVGTGGASVVGQYGTLTVHQDGSYSYAETKDGLTVGQNYTDLFTTTVSNASGRAVNSTLQITVTGSAIGNGGDNTIIAGSGVETISGFGPKSALTGGAGLTVFEYDSVSQSTPANQTRIQNFGAGDIIDLSRVDPNFHIVKSFDGKPDELVITHLGTGNAWAVYGDTTGSGHADFQIYIPSGPSSLGAANFHL